MASVKFNKKIFEKEIGKLTSEMQNKIALFGTTVEDINEDELEIDVSPDRPDLLSYQGFKRSFLCFIGKSKGLKEYKVYPPEKDYKVTIESSLKEIRPYSVCAIVKGMKFDNEKIKEIIEIQEKLHLTVGRKRKKLAIGIYPLEKITLPINFAAYNPKEISFQPLESPREMNGLEILQRHPTGREYAHLLDGFSQFPIFKDAKQNVLSMPPIINSELTGRIDEKTKDVFIECSGSHLETLKNCLNIIVTTLCDLGGKIYQMDIDLKHEKRKLKTPDLTPQKNELSIEHVNKRLGLNLNEKEVSKFLSNMGHNYLQNKIVESPSWRSDLLHEVDLIEDIAIAYGYDNFEPEIPKISTIGESNKINEVKKRISELLVGIEFLEVSNFHLTTQNDSLKKMGLKKQDQEDLVEVESSKTEYTLARKNLSHYLIKNLSENADNEYPQKIFEIGNVFSIKNSKIRETTNLAIAITPGNFTQLKQVLKYLEKMFELKLEIKNPANENELPSHLIKGRTGQIIFNKKEIGFIGEVHPKILKNWKIKMPVAILEIDFNELLV